MIHGGLVIFFTVKARADPGFFQNGVVSMSPLLKKHNSTEYIHFNNSFIPSELLFAHTDLVKGSVYFEKYIYKEK